MRVKFRTRITILLCTIVFSVWIFFWPDLMTLDCGSDGTLCTSKTSKGDILRNRAEEHNLRHSNAELMIGMVKDKTDENIRDEGYSKYAFNDLISRRIGNHRAIPDTRHER